MEDDHVDHAIANDNNNNDDDVVGHRDDPPIPPNTSTTTNNNINDGDHDNDDDAMEEEDVTDGNNEVLHPTVSIDRNENDAPPPPPPHAAPPLLPFENAFPMDDDDEAEDDVNDIVQEENLHDDVDNDNTTTVMAHIRGTDIHVPTAAKTFLTFLRTFRSLHHSTTHNNTSSSTRHRNDMNDDDSDDDSDDEEAATPPPPPLYLNVLRDILHQSIGVPRTTTTSMSSALDSVPPHHDVLHPTSATAAVDLTKSFGIDMIHMYYHNVECQQFYHQIIQHPMELIPLMDLLLQQEYERLLAQVIRCRRRSRNDNDDDDDDEDLHQQHQPDEIENDAIVAEKYGYARYNIDVDHIVPPRIQVRPYNLKIVSNLRSLDPISMDTLICCKGMIVRCSSIIPDLKVAHFACTMCGNAVTVTIDRGRIAEPNRCTTCQTQGSYQLQHNRSIFADKQLIRLQETPDEVPAGQTPASVITFCYDTLVDSVVPGDKVEITGILRAQPIRPNPKISKIKSIYKTYIDVIHFSKISAGMQKDVPKELSKQSSASASRNTSSQWTNERIDQLKQLSNDPDIYNKLVQSLAPSIWELDNCKKGILCMLFGGNTIRVKPKMHLQPPTQEPMADGTTTIPTTATAGTSWLDDDNDDDTENNNRSTNGAPSGAVTSNNSTSSTKLNKRGDINILLCGDPGTSKSQLLSYVNKLCTRGIYTSGKGSSAVGLTASVVRDPETRDFALESGALVLSDLGICCIDEFDKMSDSTRSVLHEAMEQQTVSIAKAGIIATLHARTSVLASANPIESRYNPNRSVVDNIQLPPTLLSRFDLIYLILDAPNVEHDRRLAQHLVGLYYETPNVVEPPLDQALLRDYIEYARQNIHPEISNEAASQLIESYLEMRNPTGGASNGTRTISATARQLESLIRLSEALAKMRYSPVVTRNDAKEAIRLMKVATQAAATDPRTGKIDMDMITTGRSSNTREMEEQLDITLQELFRERRGARMAVRDVTKQLNEINNATVPHDDMVEGLRRMHADGIIQFNERTQTIFVRSTL